MTHEERLGIAVLALRKISEFGHADGCDGVAPIYECGCYERSQTELARLALARLYDWKVGDPAFAPGRPRDWAVEVTGLCGNDWVEVLYLEVGDTQRWKRWDLTPRVTIKEVFHG